MYSRSVFLAAALLTASALSAQQKPITWTLVKPAATVTQGTPFTVRLHAEIPPSWHLYSITQPPGGPVATVISLPAGSTFFMNGKIKAPEPNVAQDPNFNILTETYVDSVTFPVRVTSRAAGNTQLAVHVAFQTCTDRFCLPPTTETVEVPLSIAAAPPGTVLPVADPSTSTATPDSTRPTPAAAASTSPPTPTLVATAPAATPSNALTTPLGGSTQSLPLFLWLAAVMGALSLLTPCVFPMIPITVSYFTRTGETTRSTPTRNALIYAAGIMATFTVLGMAIALLVGAGGINRFAANPWVNLLVTTIFIAFALNLFGVWQFTLPSSLLTRLTAASNGSRGGETAGILAMGLTFTLTSFTCTAPFVGTLLVMAAQGDWQWPLLGLLVFSAVFALPFFLLAMMPSAVAKLPRSGSWLNSVKVLMGFIEIATAMKFLANADLVWQWGIFTRPVVLVVWIVTAILAAAYLAGVFSRARPRARTGPISYGFAVACIAIAFVLSRGLRGGRLGELESFLPPPEGAVTAGTASVAGELSWMVNDYAAGLARAKAENKLVLLDFTGYTCTNCRWMEANMFPRAEITKEMERFVRVRLYTDGQGELYQTQQKLELDKFGTVALPYYAIVDAEGNTQSQFLGMTRSSDEYLTFLR
ncbi:MAG: cytochrome c biogenesis protein CcdA, partial [Gemmatimonas sp.]